MAKFPVTFGEPVKSVSIFDDMDLKYCKNNEGEDIKMLDFKAETVEFICSAKSDHPCYSYISIFVEDEKGKKTNTASWRLSTFCEGIDYPRRESDDDCTAL